MFPTVLLISCDRSEMSALVSVICSPVGRTNPNAKNSKADSCSPMPRASSEAK
jgi:hypothetical protein